MSNPCLTHCCCSLSHPVFLFTKTLPFLPISTVTPLPFLASISTLAHRHSGTCWPYSRLLSQHCRFYKSRTAAGCRYTSRICSNGETGNQRGKQNGISWFELLRLWWWLWYLELYAYLKIPTTLQICISCSHRSWSNCPIQLICSSRQHSTSCICITQRPALATEAPIAALVAAEDKAAIAASRPS